MESKVKQCEFFLLKHGNLLNFETADSVRTKWEDMLSFQMGKHTESLCSHLGVLTKATPFNSKGVCSFSANKSRHFRFQAAMPGETS